MDDIKVGMDFVNAAGQGQGEVANLLVNSRLDPGTNRPFIDREDNRAYVVTYTGGNPKKATSYQKTPVNNATLLKDEWQRLDEAIMPIAEKRLIGINDLVSRGLTYDLGNGMGTTVLVSQDVSDAMEATISMDGETRGQGDRVEFGTTYLPIPIVHVDYEINQRVLETSRNNGNPLDATSAERAAKKVAEYLENMLFTDTNYSFGGGTIYSYVNFTHRNEVSLGTNWTSLTDDSNGSVGRQIVKKVLEGKQASIENHHYGPWVLYIPVGYETLLDEDYDDTRGNTIRERVMAIDGIEAIKVVDSLAANNVLMIEMKSDTVRLVRGMGIQNVQWQAEGRFVNKFKVMTIQVPQIRADHNNKCGIVHFA